MKIIHYIPFILLSMTLPAVAAQQKALARVARLQGHMINPAQQKLVTMPLVAHATNATAVDAQAEKEIDDLLEKISVPMTIFEYAQEGNLEKINELVSKLGTDINAKDENDNTALMHAAVAGHVEIVKILINKDADVNAKSKNGVTMLMIAALKGDIEIIKVLVSKGADVNARSKHGFTALMQAASWGNFYALEALVMAGADVNVVDGVGCTALMMAEANKNYQLAEYLRSLPQTHQPAQPDIKSKL